MIKKLIIYFITFVLTVNPTVLYAKNTSIKDKTKFYEIINCDEFYNDFNQFNECVEVQSLTSQTFGKLKNKKKKRDF